MTGYRLARYCSDPGCDRRAVARRMCKMHCNRAYRAGLVRALPTSAQVAARVEDAIWLLDMGEQPEQVAARLGVTLSALEMSLRRHGQPRREVMRARRRKEAS